ncbi:MAG TPA: DivIVA domain-containing protein [Clostridia bacterium]|nr:DivIVA domain-containing protein [Clostridia bacterium]
MHTPLDIENKKFSKQMMNGYSVEEVDEFLDQLTTDFEIKCRETAELERKVEELERELSHYKTIEGTLQNTLVIAQSAADEVKNTAKAQAEQILKSAEGSARQAADNLNHEIAMKKREKDEMEKQFDIYKAKMESLLISQLELLKEMKKDE